MDDDFISDLPEVLIHRIMLFLPFNDAIRIGVSSSTFYSAWRSLPILNFDHNPRKIATTDSKMKFLQNIYYSLQNRSTNFIHKLAIRTILNPGSSNLFNDVLLSAASNHLTELELENYGGIDDLIYHHRTILPRDVLSIPSLRILKVRNFMLKTKNKVLDLSSTLKKFSISECIGFYTIRIINNTNLEVLVIFDCVELYLVEIDAPNLESFEFESSLDQNGTPRPCEIRFMSDCKSLRNMKLKHTTFAESLFRENMSVGRMVENLNVNAGSKTLEFIYIDSENLKKFELKGFNGLKSIAIWAPNIQSCVLDMIGSSRCEIGFSGTKFLKVLTLCDSDVIIGSWIKKNISECCFLETLTLKNCKKLEEIQLRHDMIKNLNLLNCNALVEMHIDVPKLETLVMNLQDNIPSHQVILSGHLHVVKLSLKVTISVPEGELYENLKNFLVSFDHCRELTLDFRSNNVLMFPLEVREKMISPLYDVKHLKIQLGSETHNFSHLLSGLLWLVPLPDTITFTTPDGNRSIQFKYADFNIEEDDKGSSSCCYFYPVKCWRHRLRSIQLKNFKDRYIRESVVNYLGENAMNLRLESIHDELETTSPIQELRL